MYLFYFMTYIHLYSNDSHNFIIYLQSILLGRTVAYIQRTRYEIVLDINDKKYANWSYNL